MSNVVIQVENLTKEYRLGTINHGTLYKDLQSWWSRLRGKEDPNSLVGHPKSSPADSNAMSRFLALDDVSFQIQQGDVVGIIGRNGAGKSTLLKILSQVTCPTSGVVKLNGRVASLLEVGTGFHPELTGRENIFLNGAILGMSKAEISRKFDEIVAFSELEKFIDTPVKRYSSGMYVRLAFAVAAHLEPEILIIDEVLAVGDAQFQKKCLGKMEEVGKEGRTVLLVSHSMTTIQALTKKAIFLDRGKTEGITSVHEAVGKYMYGGEFGNTAYFKAKDAHDKDAYIIEAKLLNQSGQIVSRYPVYEPVTIEISWINKAGVPISPNFMLENQNGIKVMIASDVTVDWTGEKKKTAGKYVSRAVIPPNLLNANDYIVHVALDCSSPRLCQDVHSDALRFSLYDPMDEKCLARGYFTSVREDVVLWSALEWSFEYERS